MPSLHATQTVRGCAGGPDRDRSCNRLSHLSHKGKIATRLLHMQHQSQQHKCPGALSFLNFSTDSVQLCLAAVSTSYLKATSVVDQTGCAYIYVGPKPLPFNVTVTCSLNGIRVSQYSSMRIIPGSAPHCGASFHSGYYDAAKTWHPRCAKQR